MKRGTTRHKKMHALASALGVRLYSAVGIMEMLWHYAAQHTPEGDIGSVPDCEIASAVSWEKKPEKLVDGMVLTGWLERSESHRLIIHDWPDHCEQSVRKWLDRNRKTFLPIYGQLMDSVRTNDGQIPEGVHGSRGFGLAGSSEELKPTNTEKPSTRARAGLTPDETFGKFRAAYPGITATAADWHKAVFEWRPLDWEQKLAAIDGIAVADPAHVKLPQNYLADREWTRPKRPEPKSKLERMMDSL